MTDEALTETETLGSDEVEAERPETVEESARAVMEELQASADPESEAPAGDDQKPTVDASEAARILARSKGGKKGGKGGKRVIEAKDLELEPDPQPAAEPRRFDPPQRFPLEKKEWFNRQPPEVQEEVVKGWGDLEAKYQSSWQEMAREKARHAEVNSILDHYKPKWHARGFTETSFIAEMAATWDNLQSDGIGTVDKMLRTMGITPEQLYQYRQQGGQAQHVAPQQFGQQQPQNVLTAEQVRTILREEREQLDAQAATSSAAQEVQQVQRQTGADGRYLYPELHDENYLKGLQPLVQSLRTTHPTLSWGEVFKRAVHATRLATGQSAELGSPPNGSRLSPQEISAAKSASVSIRGRGNASIPVMAEAKKGESVRESAIAAYAALKSNQQH